MRFRFVAQALAVAALAGLVGCRADSETICGKMDALETEAREEGHAPREVDPKTAHSNCVRFFEDVRAVSPAAHERAGKCARMSTFERASACLFEVMSTDPRLLADFEKEYRSDRAARRKRQAEAMASWPELAARRFEGSLRRPASESPPVPFAITLAEGFTESAVGTSILYEHPPSGLLLWVDAVADSTRLDEEARIAEQIGHTVVKREARGEGFVLETRAVPSGSDKPALFVSHVVRLGGAAVRCKALLPDVEPATQDVFERWLDALCGSLRSRL